LISVDSYMNLQIANAEEYIGESFFPAIFWYIHFRRQDDRHLGRNSHSMQQRSLDLGRWRGRLKASNISVCLIVDRASHYLLSKN
jgi:hypothetical protein